jgi:SAM-dependent methyltransferase
VSGLRSDRYHNRIDFYARVVGQWIPDRTASILVVGGGQNDADVFSAAGFRNVTFTNLVSPAVVTQGPFTTVAADAESLPFPDGAYDYAVAHAVLHHCRSPHQALLELYRVARRSARHGRAQLRVSLNAARGQKTIASFAPHARHRISYAYGFGTPCDADPSRWRLLGRRGLRGLATGPWPRYCRSSETCSLFASRSRCCRGSCSHGSSRRKPG